MVSKFTLDMAQFAPPETLISGFHIEAEDDSGKVIEIFRQENNYQRLFRLLLPFTARRVRLRIDTVRGAGNKRIFSFDLK